MNKNLDWAIDEVVRLAKQEVIKDILKHGSWKRVEELAKELKVQEG
jgi:hypothetical protein